MTRAHGVRTMMPRWMLIGAACAMALACTPSGDKGATTKSDADVRDELLGESRSNYTYGPARPPVPVDTTDIRKPGGSLPAITIATATQMDSRNRVPGHKFVYMLYSSAAYPIMGLAPGNNYIWRDTSSGPEGPYRTLVVPENTAYPMTWLLRDVSVASYAPGSPPEPRLVKSILGYGACDLNCSPTHCAFKESLRAFSARSDAIRIGT